MQKRWGTEHLLTQNEQYSIKLMKLRAGKHHHLKYHYQKTETLVMVSGTGYVLADGKFYGIKAGDVVTILPRTLHKLWCIKELCVVEINCPPIDDGVCLEKD